VKQPVDAVEHVFVLYKLAPVGLLNASLHSCNEASLIFEHPRDGVFYELLGILAVGNGQSLEARFNVGREMYFHGPRVRKGCAHGKAASPVGDPAI